MKNRLLLISLLVLLFMNHSFSQSNDNGLVALWQFEELQSKSTPESVSSSRSLINGFHKLKDGVKGKGFLLDGYTSYLEDKNEKSFEFKDGFTLSSWIAIQAYPWNWVGIIDKQIDETSGYNLSIDANGYVKFEAAINGKIETVKSSSRINLLEWAHLAGVYEPNQGLILFINGKEVANKRVKGEFSPPEGINLWIGRSHIKLPPA
ncbi:MAG: LamG domain-containing protein, partial [Melioribacteraceae bacterium]|nr:LamG domain-containing protein [Melioribacteraceae bacterium]